MTDTAVARVSTYNRNDSVGAKIRADTAIFEEEKDQISETQVPPKMKHYSRDMAQQLLK